MAAEPQHQQADLADRWIPGPGQYPEDEITVQQSLTQAVYARRDEYVEPRKIRIKIGSWNVGNHSCARDIGPWFVGGKGVETAFSKLSLDSASQSNQDEQPSEEGFKDQEARQANLGKHESTIPKGDQSVVPSDEEINLYVLGLQEIVDVGSPTEAFRPYTDPATASKYKEALQEALPDGYVLVAEQQLVGLLLIIFACPVVAQDIKSATTTSVGTGLMGYMGNKGGVTAHFILGEATRMVFINSHLAAGADKTSLERRNWDASTIVTRTRFDKVEDPSGVPQPSGETIGMEDFAFWFGDLNYRLESIPGEDVRRLLSIHLQNKHDAELPEAIEEANNRADALKEAEADKAESKAELIKATAASKSADDEKHEVPEDVDPASLQTTLSSLLPHDELQQQIKLKKAFHEGWKEGPIRFLPTYKYDAGTVAVFDSSEKKRSPSWCDRILYRTRADYEAYRKRRQDEEDARRMDELMKSRGLEEQDENVLFDYNPEEDAEQYNPETPTLEKVITRDGQEDEILLEYYMSHQRVLSSDHKPLEAIFSLTYQAVVPEKKTKIHQEVARDLDRRENEGRPVVTIVIDKPPSVTTEAGQKSSGQTADLGHVRFKNQVRVNGTIANTGQVPATLGK